MPLKFCVGDEVAAVTDRYAITNKANGWTGVITKIVQRTDGGYGITVSGNTAKGRERGWHNQSYAVYAEDFELVNPEKVEPPETDPFAGLFNERGKQT